MKNAVSYLILPPAIWPVLDHAIEIGLQFLKENPNSKLFIISVDNSLRFNPSFNRFNLITTYFEAKFRLSNLDNLLKSKNFQRIELKKIISNDKKVLSEVKDLASKCALNTIQAHYKDTSLVFDGSKRFFIKKAFLDFLDGYKFVLNIIEKDHNLENIYIYNGRMSLYRGVLTACEDNNINYFCYEYPFQGRKRYLLTSNSPIHNLSYRSKRLKYVAHHHPLSRFQKIKIGKEWMIKRNSSRMGFEMNFSNIQIDKKLPFQIKKAKENGKKILLLLNSSEWEWSGFKESQTNIFGSQIAAIDWVLESFIKNNSEYFLVFRFHPQFAFRDIKFKDKLYKLIEDKKLKNVLVIQPDSPTNTNMLINFSDLILTFYSSTAPEASFNGKRVISIGPSSFQEFKCCEMAKDKNDLKNLLSLDSDLDNVQLKIRKDESSIFFFSRAFQGFKTNFLKYDENNNAFFIKNGKKIYFYKPIYLNILFRIFRAFFIVLENPKKFNFRKISLLRKINQLFF